MIGYMDEINETKKDTFEPTKKLIRTILCSLKKFQK